MLNFDRSTVKHALQNTCTQNDCHQWLSHSFRVHQIRFRPWLRPGHPWGSLQRSPDPLAGLRGTLLLRGTKGKRREGRGGEWKGVDAPLCKFLDQPLDTLLPTYNQWYNSWASRMICFTVSTVDARRILPARVPGMSIGMALCLCLSVTSRFSIESDERIELIFVMEASFDFSCTLS